MPEIASHQGLDPVLYHLKRENKRHEPEKVLKVEALGIRDVAFEALECVVHGLFLRRLAIFSRFSSSTSGCKHDASDHAQNP